MVVSEVVKTLDIKNVNPVWSRVEDHAGRYDFIVSRAVTSLPEFCKWVGKNLSKTNRNKIPNSILYLKGGDIRSELNEISARVRLF